MTMKKIPLLLLSFAFLWCASCSKCDVTNQVAVLLPQADGSNWGLHYKYLKSALEAADMCPVFYLSSDKHAAVQVEQLRDAVSRAYKYFIIAPVDADTLVNSGLLHAAKSKGATVICHNRLIYNTDAVQYFSANPRSDVGTLQASAIVQAYEEAPREGYSLVLLAGPAADKNAALFFEGAMTVMQPYFDDGRWTVPDGACTYAAAALDAWSEESAYQRMTQILTDHYPNGALPDAILAPDDLTAQGVVRAIVAHAPETSSFPVITGQGNTQAAQARLQAGTQTMTLENNISIMAVNTVHILALYLAQARPELSASQFENNGVVDVPFVSTPVRVVTPSDL